MPEYENRTRRELSAALRELLRQRPLDQLRVRELTERCGLRRQSFYYHFKDVYDLFAWSVRQERALLLVRLAECLTWREALLDLLERVLRRGAGLLLDGAGPGRPGRAGRDGPFGRSAGDGPGLLPGAVRRAAG